MKHTECSTTNGEVMDSVLNYTASVLCPLEQDSLMYQVFVAFFVTYLRKVVCDVNDQTKQIN